MKKSVLKQMIREEILSEYKNTKDEMIDLMHHIIIDLHKVSAIAIKEDSVITAEVKRLKLLIDGLRKFMINL